ncbi:SAM-dependent methyltransferase [Kutzneria viridogrisea]|uniref:SAM-dependent methyltransferase n=1 Tax=Kutzneria viridogrisea TaxID=47990 RepID=UPI0015FF1473
MARSGGWIPDSVDVNVPAAARVYDYLLGGGHNLDADRAVAAKVLQALPDGRQVAASNRAFMRRAVLYMLEQGITQFLDLGSGIPTVGNVHEVAQQANPEARVVYVDYDEVAVAHSQLLLQGNPLATVVEADLCRPEKVLNDPGVLGVLDFDRPIGLLMVAVFHFVGEDRKPREIVAKYRQALPPGSMMALSHLTADHKPAEMAVVVEAMKNSRDPMYFRSHAEVVPLFEGFDLVEPGVVGAPSWHPELGAQQSSPEGVYVGLGRVR